MTEINDLTFKLTPKGIHLVRNKYTYQLIPYDEVEDAFLVKGRSVKNWVIISVLGGLLVSVAVLLLYHLTKGLSIDDKTVRFYNIFGHGLVAVIILGGAGVISIYSALKTVPVIRIMTKKKTYNLRVLKNQKKIKKIVDFFNSYGVQVDRRELAN